MVELNDASVANVIWREVIVLYFLGIEAATERHFGVDVICGKPLTEAGCARARIKRGQRPREPARFQRIGEIGSAADPDEPVLLAGLEQRGEHGLAIGPGTDELKARLSRHAVAQS